MKKALVIAIALTLVLAVTALAGQNAIGKLAVHVKAHPTSCTKSYPTFTTCHSIVFTWPNVGDIDVMPVFYDLTQYTVTETGLLWPEAAWGSASWVRCKGDVSVGSITHSVDYAFPVSGNNGTAIAWSTCQVGWGIAPGFAWLAATGPGSVCPRPYPSTGDYGTVDCTPSPGPYYDHPMCVSCAGIASIVGDDPCRPTATSPSTWGEIKSVFK